MEIKTLVFQQQIQRARTFYKSLHGLAPNYLCSKFERRETEYNLRNSVNKLNVPLPRTNYYKNSFSYSGGTLWNSLPRDIRQADTALVESSFSEVLSIVFILVSHPFIAC